MSDAVQSRVLFSVPEEWDAGVEVGKILAAMEEVQTALSVLATQPPSAANTIGFASQVAGKMTILGTVLATLCVQFDHRVIRFANNMADEVVAIQQVLGINPHDPPRHTDVAGRLKAIEERLPQPRVVGANMSDYPPYYPKGGT